MTSVQPPSPQRVTVGMCINKKAAYSFHFLCGQVTVDDIDLGRGPETTVYHLNISHNHTLSLRQLNLKYLIITALIKKFSVSREIFIQELQK